ncbi:MAG TPA: preprotein translocase subunit SecA [Solirubrobacterales bacterium]|nr:preprotein translocase subunit SecA [Solirubrobacterales bacterium]
MANARDMVTRALRVGEGRKLKTYERRAKAINEIEQEMELLDDDELREEADKLRAQARDGKSLDELLPDAFALTREAARRSIGQRHYDVQLIGGMTLHDGAIAEMKTGEGKTLTATLAVFLNTLAGDSVHLVTVNDYLARRDAEWMKPVYDALGVSVAALQDSDDPAARGQKYACDVVYGTNSEFGFDYLRDNMAETLAHCVQRDHRFAIVDEVDNILIDEARTPLIISGAPEQAAQIYYKFARLVRQMKGVPAKDRLKSLGESKDTSEADYDYEYDEKHKTVSPTERGVKQAEEYLGVDNLYLGEHGSLVNHLVQALKAESLYRLDKDYAVVEGEVMIIDEFTGRILEGRRWSEGLHQAVEAKEGVSIGEENQTLATITLQNYFRLYDKLSGMTGTALTEATEFMKIYKVPVVEIPTNTPMVRADHNDQIFKTKDGKWRAVLEEIVTRHERGQPILVGTVSVEVSEMISGELKRNGIEHAVLNARPEHAQREGERIAEAGRKGAVMIATNMAGRGVDIKLGGDPEHMAHKELKKQDLSTGDEGYEEALEAKIAELEPQCKAEGEEVCELGGLYICGTERHESRRIDNQLRGRSGRQGDPGESRFFLSAEDDVIRLFAGDRIYKVLDRFGGEADEDGAEIPLEAKLLTKTVEGAQKKVEEQNFLIRKRVLEYDDVMNEQRRVVYRYRREILEGRDMSDIARDELEGVVDRLVDEYTAGDLLEEWDLPELEQQLRQIWPVTVDVASMAPETVDREKLKDSLDDDAMSAYDQRESELGEELMRYLERSILLQTIDNRWREHLFDMDYLREGIHLRGFAQIDPLVAYKNEGFAMFEQLMHSIWEEFSKLVFNAQVEIDPSQLDGAFAGNGGAGATALDYSGGTPEAQPSALQQVAAGTATGPAAATAAGPGGGNGAPAPEVVETVVKDEREKEIGRNDPCWCGSGKKFKKCHGA